MICATCAAVEYYGFCKMGVLEQGCLRGVQGMNVALTCSEDRWFLSRENNRFAVKGSRKKGW